MISEIKRTLFTNWHLMRWIALLAGGFFLLQAIRYWDMLSGLVGGIFLFQAITNSGCFGSRSCSVPSCRSTTAGDNDSSDPVFTEINQE